MSRSLFKWPTSFNKQSKIYVCKPKFPSNKELNKLLAISRKAGYITNNGPLVQKFESELKQLLQVEHISLTSSGTIALIIMLKALKNKYNKSEVVTTPFSFVATSSAILAAGCIPVFSDLVNSSPFIDPHQVAKNINTNTLCVLSTHVYGYNSNSDLLNDVCSSYNVPLLFDAAHALGCAQDGKSLPSLGYASIISTHATKALSSAEGGAIISDDSSFIDLCNQIRDFSYSVGSQIPLNLEGVNGKQSELHAAVGLANLSSFSNDILKRKYVHSKFNHSISISSTFRPLSSILDINDNFSSNYLYYPIIPFDRDWHESDTENTIKYFQSHNIFARRYFYPSLDTLVSDTNCTNSRIMASKVICLPCHSELNSSEIERISKCLSVI